MMKIHDSQLFIKFALGIVSCIGIVQLQKKQLTKPPSSYDANVYLSQESQYIAQAGLQKRFPGLGFDNLMADWIFLQFLQYFGDGEARTITGYSVVPEYFEAIINHDPHFIDAQLVISPANSLFAAQPETTIQLLEKTLATVTADTPGYPFFLWTYKATDEILFLGDLYAAGESYKMAANWAKYRQDELGDELSERFKNTVTFLATNPDPHKAQFGAWMNVLSSATDHKTRQYVLDKLREIGAEVIISPDGRVQVNPPEKA